MDITANPCRSCGKIPDWNKAYGVKDNIKHPSHYTSGKVECIDAIEAATTDLKGMEAVCTANAIKYLWRWKKKGGTEDLKKARWYVEYLINHREECHSCISCDQRAFTDETLEWLNQEVQS